MIPLWKGKNFIYFGVITIIPFDNLYRRAYFVMHIFLVNLRKYHKYTPVSRQAVLCDWVWRADVNTGFRTITLVLYIGSILAT